MGWGWGLDSSYVGVGGAGGIVDTGGRKEVTTVVPGCNSRHLSVVEGGWAGTKSATGLVEGLLAEGRSLSVSPRQGFYVGASPAVGQLSS